jgi:hypothetical protein
VLRRHRGQEGSSQRRPAALLPLKLTTITFTDVIVIGIIVYIIVVIDMAAHQT